MSWVRRINIIKVFILYTVTYWLDYTESIGGDGIPGELFQILKDDAGKLLHSASANLENSAVATALEQVSFHSSPKEGQCQQMFKLLDNCTYFTRW